MTKYYNICSDNICIKAPFFAADHPDWRRFEVTECEPDISIECRVCDKLPSDQAVFRGTTGEISVFACGNNVYRYFLMGGNEGAVTCYNSEDTSNSVTCFTQNSFRVLTDERYLWNSVSLAQLMLPKKTVFVHSSFIEYSGKAILFTGPCGIGKSTQAALWHSFKNSVTVNGDKAGVSIRNGNAYADGLPFCGTSGICLNRSAPLCAVVALGQSSGNSVKRLSGVEALQALMKNVYLDLLAPGENGRCVDLVLEILSSVPVYQLNCTPDENAVYALENELKREGIL